jgi:hypothetical protein
MKSVPLLDLREERSLLADEYRCGGMVVLSKSESSMKHV